MEPTTQTSPQKFDISICMATRDDPQVWMTANAILAAHPHLHIQIVIVDNSRSEIVDGSEKTNPYMDIRRMCAGDPRITHLRAVGGPSTSKYKNQAVKACAADVFILCDSHVVFYAGAIDAALKYFQDNPESRDLLTGPVFTWHGICGGTQQMLYASEATEEVPIPADARVCHGMVFRGNSFGVWVTDPRGLDLNQEPYEIQQQGTGALCMRKAAWTGYHPSHKGWGGDETYLMEMVRRHGGKVMCHPKFRWIHSWFKPVPNTYTPDITDIVRNNMVAAGALGMREYYDATVEAYSAQWPQTVEHIKGQIGIQDINKGMQAYEALKKRFGAEENPPYITLAKLIHRRTSTASRSLEIGGTMLSLLLDTHRPNHHVVMTDKPELFDGKVSNTTVVDKEWRPKFGELFDMIVVNELPPFDMKDCLLPGGTVMILGIDNPALEQFAKDYAQLQKMQVMHFKPHAEAKVARPFIILRSDMSDHDSLPPGVGKELTKIFDSYGVPACNQCMILATQMNAWGPEGCEQNMDYIIKDMMPRAKAWAASQSDFAMKLLGTALASLPTLGDMALKNRLKSHVRQAIKNFKESLEQPSPSSGAPAS